METVKRRFSEFDGENIEKAGNTPGRGRISGLVTQRRYPRP